MKYLAVLLLTATSSLQALPPPRPQSTLADRSLYPMLATRFQDTLKTHPPVTECQLFFHHTEEQLTITIEISLEKLKSHLANVYQIRRPTNGDAERYLVNFRKNIQKAAAEVFVAIPLESIQVKTTLAK